MIGSGAFGEVFIARWCNILNKTYLFRRGSNVAVKVLKGVTEESVKDFQAEAMIMT